MIDHLGVKFSKKEGIALIEMVKTANEAHRVIYCQQDESP